MRKFSRLALLAAATFLTAPAVAAPAPQQSVPISSLVKQVAIPNSMFKLRNGLTVIVHEDHKAPIAAVTVWYNVGSKDEPKGKTGFAHLFEHLMFNGTENLPGDFFTYLQQVGGTDYNGQTGNDRTRYFETVPSGALERALFMESDRMGHLLGAVTQGVLDNQRGVVQNEKRQGDSAPGGLVQYALFENLFPASHPYHHTVIGSMADLDAASLEDVKQWFRDRYGPNNAVLVIAGDVTAAQAKPLVEKYFGSIPAGPVNHPTMATVPTLAKAKHVELHDQLAFTVLQRYWAVPGVLSKQLAALDIGGSILGGLSSSRLDEKLVRNEKVAVQVSAGLTPLQRAGIFSITAYVRPGVDPAVVNKRLDEILADYLAKGPTQDEIQRAVMSEVSGRIRGLEQVGSFNGKAVALAEGQTLAGTRNFYKQTLDEYAAVTPAAVRSALQQWLRRPALSITLSPGERGGYEEAKTVAAAAPKKDEGIAVKPTRTIPPVGPLQPLSWPTIQHARLSNGIELVYANRNAVPLTQVALSFDAGGAADPVSQRGLGAMTLGLLEQGTATLSSQQVAEAEERLGAEINATNDYDRSSVTLSALSPNLQPSLHLLADIIEHPAFAPSEIDRVRAQSLAGLAQLMKDPQRVGYRVLPGAIFGAAHPYGAPQGGDPAAIAKFTQADLAGFKQRWLRPDNVKIFVVSNLPLAEVQTQLEAAFGKWAAPATPKGTKAFPTPPARPASPKILLVNRPGAPQSTIIGGQLLPINPYGDVSPFNIANEALGGQFLSRLNMDLRETKGWSYGVSGSQSILPNGVSYTIDAPVQADRTADALAALNSDIADFLGSKGMTPTELDLAVTNSVNALPGEFETSGALLGGIMRNDLMRRPEDYYVRLPARYKSVTAAEADRAIRTALDPKGFTWVVVGDAAKLKPQLEKLGMPVEIVEAQ
jgi:predicted Zn-dependent peptidase